MFCKAYIVTNSEMSFNHLTRSKLSIKPEVNKHECLVRRSDRHNESSYHSTRASSRILLEEAEIMDAWKQDLDDLEGKDADNVLEAIEIEDKECNFDRERSQTTDHPPRNLLPDQGYNI